MKPVKLRENTGIDLSLKNLISIIIVSSLAVWGYFGIVERLNNIETNGKLMIVEVEKNTTFRIDTPKKLMEQQPVNKELYLLVETLFADLEEVEKEQQEARYNKVNIEFLKDQLEKALADIERLKDKQREFANGNGH